MQSSLNDIQPISLKNVNPKKCCSHTCPRSTHLVPGQQLLRCSGCKAVSYCDRQCQRDAWALHKSACKLQRNANSSMPEASNTTLPSLDPLFDLLKYFINLHKPTFSEATLSCIITKGGPKTFDFRGHVMFFGLQYRNDNPGTAFAVSFADCLPIGTLYLQLPHIKDVLQASEEKYNSVAEFDKATMEHFAGLIRVVFEFDGCFYFQNIPIRDNPQGDAADHVNWLLELKLSVDSGLVGKEVGGKYQMGKVIKQGERWKWMPLSGLS